MTTAIDRKDPWPLLSLLPPFVSVAPFCLCCPLLSLLSPFVSVVPFCLWPVWPYSSSSAFKNNRPDVSGTSIQC
ncbi:MAG: hypothetical protein ACI9HK_002716 [Pirellulaceae bacterium]|jgi:hypothetical protein